MHQTLMLQYILYYSQKISELCLHFSLSKKSFSASSARDYFCNSLTILEKKIILHEKI